MVVLIISLVYIIKILYLSYLVWGKGNITKLKRVRKNQFATKQNLKKQEKISSKKKKVNQEREGHIYQRKRRKLQDDNSNEKMIIKNQRPDIKIVNEKRRSKMVSALKSIKPKLKSPKIEKEEHAKRKITEDILNDLTFEEGYTDSVGSDCNQIQTSDSSQYLLDYFDEVQELGDWNCLFRALARGAFDDNQRYDELHDAIWYFILARRNTFSSFVENEDVEVYIQSMRKDGEYWGEIEIIAFSMMLQISVWKYNQESSLDTHLQYENVNSTRRINLRYYEDDLHYNSLRVKEGYKAIDFDEAMEKVNPEDAEEPIITGQNEKNRAFWGEKKKESILINFLNWFMNIL